MNYDASVLGQRPAGNQCSPFTPPLRLSLVKSLLNQNMGNSISS